ncbi:MAG: helix-turn-helix transcriptional regulator, partial [Desulfobacterales bacterium]
MTHDPQSTSFGLFLQSARIEKKISIEALAAETRIRVEVLKRLEAEEHDHLPDEVFVKGFIRTYAEAVGADAKEALERYRSSRTMRNVGHVGPTTRSPQPKRFWLVM